MIGDVAIVRILWRLELKLRARVASDLDHYIKDETQLRKGRAPRGYILQQSNIGFGNRAKRRATQISESQERESSVLQEVILLISQNRYNLTPTIIHSIRYLLRRYESDFDDILIIEVSLDSSEAILLHQIDDILMLLRTANLEEFVPKLQHLKKRADYWIKQDLINAQAMYEYGLRLLTVLNRFNPSIRSVGFGGQRTIRYSFNSISTLKRRRWWGKGEYHDSHKYSLFRIEKKDKVLDVFSLLPRGTSFFIGPDFAASGGSSVSIPIPPFNKTFVGYVSLLLHECGHVVDYIKGRNLESIKRKVFGQSGKTTFSDVVDFLETEYQAWYYAVRWSRILGLSISERRKFNAEIILRMEKGYVPWMFTKKDLAGKTIQERVCEGDSMEASDYEKRIHDLNSRWMSKLLI